MKVYVQFHLPFRILLTTARGLLRAGLLVLTCFMAFLAGMVYQSKGSLDWFIILSLSLVAFLNYVGYKSDI